MLSFLVVPSSPPKPMDNPGEISRFQHCHNGHGFPVHACRESDSWWCRGSCCTWALQHAYTLSLDGFGCCKMPDRNILRMDHGLEREWIHCVHCISLHPRLKTSMQNASKCSGILSSRTGHDIQMSLTSWRSVDCMIGLGPTPEPDPDWQALQWSGSGDCQRSWAKKSKFAGSQDPTPPPEISLGCLQGEKSKPQILWISMARLFLGGGRGHWDSSCIYGASHHRWIHFGLGPGVSELLSPHLLQVQGRPGGGLDMLWHVHLWKCTTVIHIVQGCSTGFKR